MSLPLCLGAKILNIKLLLFEPNMVLGRSKQIFFKLLSKNIFVILIISKNFLLNLKIKLK